MPRPGRPGPFLGRPIELFHVAGIAIAVHPSWLLVAAGIAVLLRFMVVDHIAGIAGIGAAVGVMLIFYTCVILHELAHSLVARRHGLEPKRIVLFLLGGVSQIDKEATRPSHEYQVALAGPLTSLVIAGILFAVSRTLSDGTDLVTGIWGWLAWLNLLLAGFNLVPGFPLDGGRVLRSALWAITGDRPKATRIAAAGGKLVAVALMVGGVVGVFTFGRESGGAYAPVSFVVVGWFLYSMAGAAAEREGAYPVKPEAPAAPVEPAPDRPVVVGPLPVVLPAGDIIPATPGRRGATATKRAVPAAKRGAMSRGALPPPTPPRRPARKNDRTASAKAARLKGNPSVGKSRSSKSAYESPSAKSNARSRAAGSSNRARSAGASRDQSRNRARHSRAGSSDARGNARRGR
jgi:Zn-dependent protease